MPKETIERFNQVAYVYDDCCESSTPAIRNYFYNNKHYTNTEPGKILDIGCGTGIIGEHFLRQNWDVYCLDGAPKMLNECLKKGLLTENLLLIDLETEKIPAAYNNRFDITTCRATLIYLNNACDVIKRMIEVTKPEGTIVFNIPHHKHGDDTVIQSGRGHSHLIFSVLDKIQESGGKLVDTHKTPHINIFQHKHHNHIFTVKKLKHLDLT
ncbi:MAG: class I SAM-dependent methyltransferase [Alphaproteobacteria bacterium]